MTLNETVNSISRINVGGYYNREKCSRAWLKNYISCMTRSIGKEHIFEAALPDGWWYISVMQFADGEYTYYIPDTREQEAVLKKALFG